MKRIILFFALLFFASGSKAQTTFFKTIGGSGEQSNYIEQTTDGGYFIAGECACIGGEAGYVIKLNAVGDTVWTKGYEGFSRLYSGAQTTDGGYILVGEEVPAGSGYSTIYVLKIDSLGAIQWQKSIRGAVDNAIGNCIKQTSDGGYIIVGSNGLSGSGADFCMLKLDITGSIQWDITIGNEDNEQAYSVAETTDGGYVVSGLSAAVGSCLLRVSNSGSIMWIKEYNDSSIGIGQSVLQTSDGGYMIARDVSYLGNSNLSVLKTDSSGAVIWNKIYAGTTGSRYNRMAKANSGNFILSSSINDKMLFTLIDNNGNEIWSRKMAFNDTSSGMISMGTYAQQTSDGGYIFTGNSSAAGTGAFIYCIKTDSSGNSGCDSSATLTVVPSFPTVTSPVAWFTIGMYITDPTYAQRGSNNAVVTHCTSVGIDELDNTSQISVFPNPSSGQVNFKGLQKENKIEIVDLTGQLVYQAIAKDDFQAVNIGDRAGGIYFYRISKEMKLIQQGKIVLIK